MYEWNATHNVTWLRRSGVEGCKNVENSYRVYRSTEDFDDFDRK